MVSYAARSDKTTCKISFLRKFVTSHKRDGDIMSELYNKIDALYEAYHGDIAVPPVRHKLLFFSLQSPSWCLLNTVLSSNSRREKHEIFHNYFVPQKGSGACVFSSTAAFITLVLMISLCNHFSLPRGTGR